MGNTRFLKVVILALLLINIGTLTFMWLHRPGVHGFGPNGPADFLIKSIGFDANQQTEFARLRESHQQAMHNFKQQNGDVRQRFYAFLANPQADSTQWQPLADSIAAGQKQIELVTFRHFQAVRALCRPEQQPKFDAVIGEALQNMQPLPPPAPAPPPR